MAIRAFEPMPPKMMVLTKRKLQPYKRMCAFLFVKTNGLFRAIPGLKPKKRIRANRELKTKQPCRAPPTLKPTGFIRALHLLNPIGFVRALIDLKTRPVFRA